MIDSGDYQVAIHLAKTGELRNSNRYIDLHKDPASDQFFLEVPRGILDAVNPSKEPDRFEMEIIAQRLRPGSKDRDPWFIRKSPPLSIDVLDAFIDWSTLPARLLKLPFFE